MQNEREYVEDTKRHIGEVGDSIGEFLDAIDDAAEECSREAADVLDDIAEALERRADGHDASKLEEPEKAGFMAHGPKGSATAGLLQLTLSRHRRANRHHPEHWQRGIAGMTLVDLVEMYADWEADGDMGKAIAAGKDAYGMSDELVSLFRETADGKELTHAVDEDGAGHMNLTDLATLFARWVAASGSASRDGISFGGRRVAMQPQLLSVFGNTAAAWRKGDL